jgi:sugar phosphate isomerase/epimerase
VAQESIRSRVYLPWWVCPARDRIVHVHFNDSPNLPPGQIHDNQRLLPGEDVFGRTKDMTPEAAAKAGLDSSLSVFRKSEVPKDEGTNNES